MRTPESPRHSGSAAGFTLPAVLVVTGALLILAVGILLVASIERSTARSFVDRQRAELAAQAGLEDPRSCK
jgi:Tfp pilus assembly protein PilV